MQIKRKVLLGLLDKMMPVISSKSAVEYQNINFYGNRVQATNGRIWVDIETGFELDIQVRAEPFFLLVKKLKAKDLNLELKDSILYVSTTKSEGEFHTYPTAPAEIPVLENQIAIENAEDFIQGLRFCRLGVSGDDLNGPLCGVGVKNGLLWGCDKYRILRWVLDKPTNITACAPAKLADILHSFKEEIQAIHFAPGENGGGCFGVTLESNTTIWASGIEGEYKDLNHFFPEGEAEVLEFESEFSDILERQLANLKDVKGEEKEATFIVSDKDVTIVSQKFSPNKEVERKLEDTVDLKNPRAEGSPRIEFGLNPSLLKDVVGLSLSFKFHSEQNVVVFETDKFRYMVMARG
jgi:hypothetical protein